MSEQQSSDLTRAPSWIRRQPSKLRRRLNKFKRPSSVSHPLPVMIAPEPERRSTFQHRRESLRWSSEILSVAPRKSVNPKEYLVTLSSLLAYASHLMTQASFDKMIWAFNRAYDRNDRIAMRQLGDSILPTLYKIQKAYLSFRDTSGALDQEEIWKMIISLGDEGESFWDIVDELGELIEILEGEETNSFWTSLEEAVNS